MLCSLHSILHQGASHTISPHKYKATNFEDQSAKERDLNQALTQKIPLKEKKKKSRFGKIGDFFRSGCRKKSPKGNTAIKYKICHQQKESHPLNIILFYNDEKINTKSTIHHLQSHVPLNCHTCESIFIGKENIIPPGKDTDIIFFLYFVSNAREHFKEIDARVKKISNNFPRVSIHLLLLKDEKCPQWPLDRSRLRDLNATTDYFTIYSQKYAEFTLSPDEFIKPNSQHKYLEVKENYEKLCQKIDMKIKGYSSRLLSNP